MPDPKRSVPLCIPNLDAAELDAVAEVLKSGWLAHGPLNHEFEHKFREFLNVPHAVSMNSCTSALFLALVANGIRGEVILPSFTFVASANAVVTAGATPVFADVEYETCNLDPDAAEALITPAAEALMVVHYAGQVADMARFAQLAKKHKLLLIEDSAEAIGAEQHGIKTGGWGTGCFSFFPTKNLTTGEGGMLTTRDAALAAKVKALVGHGIESTTLAREKKERPWLRAATYAGYNFRLSNVLAALGARQMDKLEAMNEARRKHAKRYDELLDRNLFDLPVERPGFKHVYQMYVVKAKGFDRTRFLATLKEAGVGASVHFDPPVHTQPFYAEAAYPQGALEVTERLAASCVTLPMYPQMTDDDVAYVAACCNRAARELGR
ncbi:MAG: DegT/DnrJ/EryC1/StrS family aminotransferase [Planctomycetota bacterium]|nr:DegT/DnrJ/EryC1/StrS family aminotransferase [Planctomycetota bacterium]